jgi:hypothetical protein
MFLPFLQCPAPPPLLLHESYSSDRYPAETLENRHFFEVKIYLRVDATLDVVQRLRLLAEA